MTYIAATLLYLLIGLAVTSFFGLLRKNLFYDLSLSWFVGAGYFSLAYFICQYGIALKTGPVVSVAIIAAPLVIGAKELFVWCKETILTLRAGDKSSLLLKPDFTLLQRGLLVFSALIFGMALIQGASTPTLSDDAIQFRAYSPMLAYMNDFSEGAIGVVFRNGIWPTYLPQLYWQIFGEIDHFFINYINLNHFFFFLLLVFSASTIREGFRQSVYTLFLLCTLPLLAVQATTTMSDLPLIAVFAIGFLHFGFYAKDGDSRDVVIAILFFTFACFIKDRGEILGLSGLGMTGILVAYRHFKLGRDVDIKASLFLVPLIAYFVIKSLYMPILPTMLHDLNITKEIKEVGEAISLTKPDALPVKSAFALKIRMFNYSIFSSGNFGVIAWVFIVSIIVYRRKLMSPQLAWQLAFMGLIFFEISYLLIIHRKDLVSHVDMMHRAVLSLAILTAIYIPYLWTGEKDES